MPPRKIRRRGCINLQNGWTMFTDETDIQNLYRGYRENELEDRQDRLFEVLPSNDNAKRRPKNMLKVNHANVAQYLDCGTVVNSSINGGVKSTFIVMKLYNLQTLENWPLQPVDQARCTKIMKQLLSGLEEIHKNDITHRDLEPNHIFYDPFTGDVVIYGFGRSREIWPTPSINSTEVESCWTSPELLNNEEIYKSTDVFSLGLIFYYILSGGNHAFGAVESRRHNIKNKKKPKLRDPLNCDEPTLAVDLITRMLSKVPSERPTIQEVRNDPFFWSAKQKVDFCCRVYKQTKSMGDDYGVKASLHRGNPCTGKDNRLMSRAPVGMQYKCPSTGRDHTAMPSFVAVDPEIDWTKKLDLTEEECSKYGIHKKGCVTGLLEACGRTQYYQYSTYSLLRFIERQRSCQVGSNVYKIMSDDCWEFFFQRFPHLLSIVMKIIRKDGPNDLAKETYGRGCIKFH